MYFIIARFLLLGALGLWFWRLPIMAGAYDPRNPYYTLDERHRVYDSYIIATSCVRSVVECCQPRFPKSHASTKECGERFLGSKSRSRYDKKTGQWTTFAFDERVEDRTRQSDRIHDMDRTHREVELCCRESRMFGCRNTFHTTQKNDASYRLFRTLDMYLINCNQDKVRKRLQLPPVDRTELKVPKPTAPAVRPGV